MSNSCACLSGPPVRRTADNGNGRAMSGTAFFICCALVMPERQTKAKTVATNIEGVFFLFLIVLLIKEISNRDLRSRILWSKLSGMLLLAFYATTHLTLVRFHCKQASARGPAV